MSSRKKGPAKRGGRKTEKEEEIEESEEAVKPQAGSEEKGAVKSQRKGRGKAAAAEKEESSESSESEENVKPTEEDKKEETTGKSDASEGEGKQEGKAKNNEAKKKRKRKDDDENDEDYDVSSANASPKKRKTEAKEKKPLSEEEQKTGEEIKKLRAIVTGCGLRIPRMKPGTPLAEKLETVQAFMKDQNIASAMTKKEMLAYKAEQQKKKDLDLASLNPKKILSMKSRTSRAKKRKNYKDPGSEEEVVSSEEASSESKEVTYKFLEKASDIQEDLQVEVQEEVDGEEGALEWFAATAVREFTKEPGLWRLKYADGSRGNVKFEKGKWRVAVN